MARARECLNEALKRLHGERKVAMAREELGRIEAGTGGTGEKGGCVTDIAKRAGRPDLLTTNTALVHRPLHETIDHRRLRISLLWIRLA